MDFWLLDVQSTVNVNGKDVAFDYINTFFEKNEALNEAKLICKNEDILQVLVVHWKLYSDGTQENLDCIFSFLNEEHRELKGKEDIK